MLAAQLRKQCADGTAAIQGMMAIHDESHVCVTLRAIAGPHIGQKFRLEAAPVSFNSYLLRSMSVEPLLTHWLHEQGNSEEVFKMGRSTGKVFKEKGISLHRDKEISTSHAKVRRGKVNVVHGHRC